MNRTAVTVLSCLIAVAVGCVGPKRTTRTTSGPTTVRLAGVIAKSKGCPDHYAFAEFERSRYNKAPIVVPTRTYRKFETHQNVKITVHKATDYLAYDYNVILGASLDEQNTEWASGRVRTSEPTFTLYKGWAFMDGAHIRAESRWVRGGAEGTNIVFEVVDDNTLRVYLLEENNPGAYIDLTCNHGTHESSFILEDEGKYVTFKQDDCTFTGPDLITADPDIKGFIDEVVNKIAREAGWRP